MPSSEHMGYVVNNQLRSGLAEQRLSLSAAGGGCSSKTKG